MLGFIALDTDLSGHTRLKVLSCPSQIYHASNASRRQRPLNFSRKTVHMRILHARIVIPFRIMPPYFALAEITP